MGRQGWRSADARDRLERQRLDAGFEEKAAHPNSRFAAPMRNNPVLDPEVENGEGVPISAIIFGGRRSDTMPLVFQAFDWKHGVYLGAHDGFGDHRRRDRRGRPGAARSDGDAAVLRLQHRRLFPALARDRAAPDESAAHFSRELVPQRHDGKFLWPGFGDNMRVLKWIVDRCEGRGGAGRARLAAFRARRTSISTGLRAFRRKGCDELLAVKPGGMGERAERPERVFKTLEPYLPERAARRAPETGPSGSVVRLSSCAIQFRRRRRTSLL